MAETVLRTHRLQNGLTLVSEALPDVRAISLQILLAVGAVTEPETRLGLSTVTENMCYRGAGSRDARELSDALDDLGLQRGGGADLESTSFAASLLADDLEPALQLYADIIRRPLLPRDQLDSARQLALQSLESTRDNPTQQLFLELAAAYYPGPHGRTALGSRAGLEAIAMEDVESYHRTGYVPEGSIIALAGRFDWERVVGTVEKLFGAWSGAPLPAPQPDTAGRARYLHVQEESAQEQIGVSWPDITANDPGFYSSRMAIQVLSGGMGARLFTEIRERRGLVYSVAAFPRTVRGAGSVLAYAGTTPERRQECLDVLLSELTRLPEGITAQELDRARIGLLSSLVMQGESCTARAAALARDQFLLGRVRSLAEVRAGVESVSTDSVQQHLQAHPPRDFTIVTLGPEPVEVS